MKYLMFLLLLAACTSPLSAPEVQSINSRINAEPYVSGRHVCRDYVEEKINALRAAGASDDDMRIAYGYTLDDKPIQHVVLIYYSRGEYMALDNRSNAITEEPDIAIAFKLRPDSAAWQQILRNPRYGSKS